MPYHEPMRLIALIEAPLEFAGRALQSVVKVKSLVMGGWIRAIVMTRPRLQTMRVQQRPVGGARPSPLAQREDPEPLNAIKLHPLKSSRSSSKALTASSPPTISTARRRQGLHHRRQPLRQRRSASTRGHLMFNEDDADHDHRGRPDHWSTPCSRASTVFESHSGVVSSATFRLAAS